MRWESAVAGVTLLASGVVADGMLELWLLRVADVDEAQLDLSLLDSSERDRAARLVSPDLRRRYVAAHVVLRRLLAAHLELAPEAVSFLREPCPRCGAAHGRPAVSGLTDPLHFSLSRSGELGLIGIAPVPVGVDIEQLAGQETVADVSTLLHPAERSEIAALAPPERPLAFTRIWTRKEAYMKGLGVGIADDLAADYLGTQGDAPAPVGWTLATLPVDSSHAAAVAIRGELTLTLPADDA
jgi:4'-phosphopantetheinyl transferase